MNSNAKGKGAESASWPGNSGNTDTTAGAVSNIVELPGDADIVGLPGIHVECKRVERLNLEDAMTQARSDAREGELPAVFHRKNNCEWVVSMTLTDWMTIFSEWEAAQEGVFNGETNHA